MHTSTVDSSDGWNGEGLLLGLLSGNGLTNLRVIRVGESGLINNLTILVWRFPELGMHSSTVDSSD